MQDEDSLVSENDSIIGNLDKDKLISVFCEGEFVWSLADANNINLIEETAFSLGVDANSYPQLIPIIKKFLSEPVPEGYKCFRFKTNGDIYLCLKTNELDTEHPMAQQFSSLCKELMYTIDSTCTHIFTSNEASTSHKYRSNENYCKDDQTDMLVRHLKMPSTSSKWDSDRQESIKNNNFKMKSLLSDNQNETSQKKENSIKSSWFSNHPQKKNTVEEEEEEKDQSIDKLIIRFHSVMDDLEEAAENENKKINKAEETSAIKLNDLIILVKTIFESMRNDNKKTIEHLMEIFINFLSEFVERVLAYPSNQTEEIINLLNKIIELQKNQQLTLKLADNYNLKQDIFDHSENKTEALGSFDKSTKSVDHLERMDYFNDKYDKMKNELNKFLSLKENKGYAWKTVFTEKWKILREYKNLLCKGDESGLTQLSELELISIIFKFDSLAFPEEKIFMNRLLEDDLTVSQSDANKLKNCLNVSLLSCKNIKNNLNKLLYSNNLQKKKNMKSQKNLLEVGNIYEFLNQRPGVKSHFERIVEIEGKKLRSQLQTFADLKKKCNYYFFLHNDPRFFAFSNNQRSQRE